MNKQDERDQRIYSSLALEKLPYKLSYKHFKELGTSISRIIYRVESHYAKSQALNWCFSDIKRTKIFLQIFHANEKGSEIYKEEISKNIPEYSYKTIAKIIDEGFSRGYYIPLGPAGEPGKDAKVKNIRPSEELIIDFLNLCLESLRSFDILFKQNKTVDWI